MDISKRQQKLAVVRAERRNPALKEENRMERKRKRGLEAGFTANQLDYLFDTFKEDRFFN